MTNQEIENITLESLRDWFKKEKWVRITTSGNIAGPCGTSKNKKNPDRCLPRAKAQSLTKAQRASTARKKKRAGAKGKTVVKNTKAATVKREGYYSNTQLEDEIRQYGYDSFEQFFADNPGAEEAVFDFIDQNLARIQKETANPQDGKAAPFGSGYKPTKKMKEEKTINKKQIQKLKDMIKSLKKSSKGHAGQADYLGKLVNEAMTKERLLAVMKNQDDAIVRLFDGTEYVVYSPYSDNKDNAEMWGDDSVIGINRDGDEREFRYEDIDDVSVYRTETKEAPAGHYFTKSGNLVKGRLTKDARERGARKSDPKDDQRSKVPPVTQYKEIKRPSKQGIKRKLRRAFLEELIWEVLTEKDDRCTRIAKQKFDTWPSAYASAAVVRCRRGKIWKKRK